MSLFVRKIQQHLIRLGYLCGEADACIILTFEKLLTGLPSVQIKSEIKVVRFETHSSQQVLIRSGGRMGNFQLMITEGFK